MEASKVSEKNAAIWLSLLIVIAGEAFRKLLFPGMRSIWLGEESGWTAAHMQLFAVPVACYVIFGLAAVLLVQLFRPPKPMRGKGLIYALVCGFGLGCFWGLVAACFIQPAVLGFTAGMATCFLTTLLGGIVAEVKD